MTPYYVKNKQGDMCPVPCGKCPVCAKRRISAWSFRLMQEDKVSSCSHFITLTYDTKHMPITRNGFMSINKRDVQLFFKRLRKANLAKLKYYAVGEYGGKTMRAHYHAIIFNADVSTIQKAWNLGHVHYGQVTGASVGYTLKYMSKGRRIPLHRNDDRCPEFGLMSKGLGVSYLTCNMVQWHRNVISERMYCNLEDGKKIAMPRYFKNKIYTDSERQEIGEEFAVKYITVTNKAIAENPNYERDKEQQMHAAFKKMSLDSKKGDKI